MAAGLAASFPRIDAINTDIELLKHIYKCFNARDIDGVLDALADDVVWANAMEGGHVHGREGVREYWTRQWAIVSPRVDPVSSRSAAAGSLVVEVRQSIRDLQGKPLENQANGLQDKRVGHIFHFKDGRVTRFDIQSAV